MGHFSVKITGLPGSLLSGNQHVTALLSPFAGKLLDQLSMKLLMLTGSLALVAGFICLSFATAFSHVLISYALLIAPANVLIGPLAASVLLSRWFDADRGRALGIAAIGISLGGFAFPPLIQSLIDYAGWRSAVQILAAIAFVFTIGACLLVIDRRANSVSSIDASAEGDTIMPTGSVLTHREFWLMTMVFGVLLTGMMGLVTNMVPLARDRGISLPQATLLISALSLGSLGGKIIFAAIADKAGARLILLFGVSGFFLGMACFVYAQQAFWMMAFGAALVGFTNGGAVPLQAIMAARTFGLSNVGRVVGLLNVTIVLAGLAVPPAFGMIYDRTGSYNAALFTYMILAVGALMAIGAMRKAPNDGGVPSLSTA
ncbi:MAG TPA: MFS transporter [Sphingobium sp.]|uniref:MFS transporter n=1 Tax=Sphingobium sp. TaxID=1912891 RepID=UPI002ED463D6